eukprot:3703592-Amphidinium_carterae.1
MFILSHDAQGSMGEIYLPSSRGRVPQAKLPGASHKAGRLPSLSLLALRAMTRGMVWLTDLPGRSG